METSTMFIVLLVIAIVCAVIMKSVAKKRKANEMLWFIIGLLIGPFAFLFIPIIGNKK